MHTGALEKLPDAARLLSTTAKCHRQPLLSSQLILSATFTLSNFMLIDPMLSDLLQGF